MPFLPFAGIGQLIASERSLHGRERNVDAVSLKHVAQKDCVALVLSPILDDRVHDFS